MSPKEVLQKAKEAKHPLNPAQVISSMLKGAVRDVLCTDPVDMAKKRFRAVVAIKKMAEELEGAEAEFKRTLHKGVGESLKSKRLLLWKALLKASNFDDVGIVDLVASGIPLVGSRGLVASLLRDLNLATQTASGLWSGAR